MKTVQDSRKPIVCAYYFPNWHRDLRNEKWHGPGWTEWEVAKCARPRFASHQQPKIPLWGYEDESDPSVMAKKIDVALSHGVDGFIFDWYWFSDGSYRAKCLENGFLNASNNTEMKFSVMWANHDCSYGHPGSRLYRMPKLIDGSVSPEIFVKATDYCIKNYFNKPNYLRLDGGLHFGVFLFEQLIESLGGEAAAKEVFRDFRHRVEKAGLGEVNFSACTVGSHTPEETFQLIERLGLNSCGAYNWNMDYNVFPVQDYVKTAKENAAIYEAMTVRCKMPYYYNVVMGADASPRAVQSEVYENLGYPFQTTLYGTPAEFEDALCTAREAVVSGKVSGRMVTINAWNEWTEGSYLEPDTIHGMAYLEAVKKVFKEGR